MNDDPSIYPEPTAVPVSKTFVPMVVGRATVFVEQTGETAVIEVDDRIYPVALPTPAEAFDAATDALRECVRSVGDRLEQLSDRVMPDEITVEFSLSFEMRGKASFIPIFVTGESGATTGLNVTAVWRPTDRTNTDG